MKRLAFLVPGPSATTLRALNYTADHVRERGPGSARSNRLGGLVQHFGRAYGSVFTRLDCTLPHGIELLSQSDMLAFAPSGRRIRLDSLPHPERHLIRRYQVLIAAAGTLGESELYGRATMADARLAGKFVGPDAMVLGFEDEGGDDNLYVYAYLSTSAGQRALRATSYGTKILRFRPDLLGDLPIPVLDSVLKHRIAELVRSAISNRDRAVEELSAARATIEQLPVMAEALEQCGERRRRATTWDRQLNTLAAWNYASTGRALATLSRTWTRCLGDLTAREGIFNGARFGRVQCDPPYGMEFLSQRDVFLTRPLPRRITRPTTDDRLVFVDENTLLVASHGQLEEGNLFGRVELAANSAYRYGISSEVLRIVPRDGMLALCYAFFSTQVGLRLLQSTATGTSVPSMRLDLVRSLPLPDLSKTELDGVQVRVNAAVEARRAADTAEREAVRLASGVAA